jgi:DNA-binding GntR family transcriptional regulator
MLHRYVTIWLPERLLQSVEEHRTLLTALEARDADAAERIMRAHVENQREALRRMHEQFGASHPTPPAGDEAGGRAKTGRRGG